MEEFFKHIENLDESDNNDYLDFFEEDDKRFLTKRAKSFFIRYMNKVERLTLLDIRTWKD